MSAIIALLPGLLPESLSAAEPVDFQRDVRPLLSEACFHCHGPDEKHREADLRLDVGDALPDGLIVAGDPAASELIKRITSDDPDLKMPPADSGKELSAEQVQTLKQWVAEGAEWAGHWAFEAPRRPELPQLKTLGDWVQNPIDAFVAARLEREELKPSSKAEAATLIRRLHLDLTGLPPTVEQADDYLNDPTDGQLRAQVQKLLDSPHYGEKWARDWLDAARYADSDGFEKDKPRYVWMYRDWVVNALNRDLPYDQFVIEQLAGDLLPSPTQDQLVATGFLRNSMLNEEGGIDSEQFRMEAMFDRMDAIGKAVLGMTIQCGQCHSHKYDPFTQTDYYRMFAFINNSHEGSLPVYPPAQLKQRQSLLTEIAKIETSLKQAAPDWKAKLQQWMDSVRGNQPQWEVLQIANAEPSNNAQRYFEQPDHSLLAQGYAPTRFTAHFAAETKSSDVRAFRLEMLTDPNLPSGGPGRSVDGLFALTGFNVTVTNPEDDQEKRTVKFVRATADYANERVQLGEKFADKQGKRRFTGPIEYAIDGDDETAWSIDAGPGRRNQSRKAVFVAADNVAFPAGAKLRISLDQKHGGWNSDDVQTMNLGRFRISVSAAEAAVADPLPRDVRAIVESGRSLDDLSATEVGSLFSHWRTTVADWKSQNEQIEKLWSEHPTGTTQLVMSARATPRETHKLERGDFLKPREQVEPGVPGFLHSLDADSDPTRLDFAKWLVDRDSPTAARAIVNRIWQSYFGTGLVETSEDLGSQGSTPSHPELLDWLAIELMDNGWSLKHLHRLIVSSATWQQSSHVTPELLKRDPGNQLLARGPRFRMNAELVRDVTLASSGLLTRTIGGRGVYPPAPEFLFLPPASYGPKTWKTETDADRYRRSLYTFRFRSVPYPSLSVFDAPPGDAPCTRRSRSNTPLQALTTLNEPLFVESARALASLALAKNDSSDAERLSFAFRRAVTRPPTDGELDVLKKLLGDARERFAKAEASGQASSLAGDATPDTESVAAPERAAWTIVSRVVLNLDEAITKE
jgi:dsRNA-specific ribonuclease